MVVFSKTYMDYFCGHAEQFTLWRKTVKPLMDKTNTWLEKVFFQIRTLEQNLIVEGRIGDFLCN